MSGDGLAGGSHTPQHVRKGYDLQYISRIKDFDAKYPCNFLIFQEESLTYNSGYESNGVPDTSTQEYLAITGCETEAEVVKWIEDHTPDPSRNYFSSQKKYKVMKVVPVEVEIKTTIKVKT